MPIERKDFEAREENTRYTEKEGELIAFFKQHPDTAFYSTEIVERLDTDKWNRVIVWKYIKRLEEKAVVETKLLGHKRYAIYKQESGDSQ